VPAFSSSRAVVFDLDGTLIDSVPLFATILNAMLVDRGLAPSVSLDRARPHATAGGRAMVAALLGEACGDIDQALAEFRERYAALPTPADCLYPGVRAGLQTLARDGFSLGLWSNKSQALCDKVIEDLGLRPLFGAIVGTRDGVPLKPDTTGYDLVLRSLGAKRDRSCFVGDSAFDYEAAGRAMVPFVMVTYGYEDYARDWPGALSVPAFAAVPAVIASLFSETRVPA
jgi:phosphoglycolate phosphatase